MGPGGGIRVVAATLALGCASLPGCGDPPEPTRSRGRVLIVGIDGASPRLTGPLAREGRLPQLRAIAEQGASGALRSIQPLLSPRIWTSVATGKTPERHGIVGWVDVDVGGRARLYTARDRRVPALWTIASQAGLEAGVVNWLLSFPPEAIDGVMISDHALPRERQSKRILGRRFARERDAELILDASQAPVRHPPDWPLPDSAQLAPRPRVANPFVGGADFPPWVPRENLAEHYRVDEQIVAWALAVDEARSPDLLMVLLQGIDRVSHRLWGNLEPAELYPEALRPDPTARARGAEALRSYYEFTDELVGRLVERFGPEDLVIVLSDHGFEAGVLRAGVTGAHETDAASEGVLFARGRGIAPGSGIGSTTVFDIVPTVLAWWGLPPGADMDGKPAPFLQVEAPDPVPSYDGLAVELLGDEPSGNERRIQEQLRALGYLEGLELEDVESEAEQVRP